LLQVWPGRDDDHVGNTTHQFLCLQSEPVRVAAAVTNVQAYVDVLDPAQIFERLAECSEICVGHRIIFERIAGTAVLADKSRSNDPTTAVEEWPGPIIRWLPV
jgi:hypothetical protein